MAQPQPATGSAPIGDAQPTIIDGWEVVDRLVAAPGQPWERLLVQRPGDTVMAVLTLYQEGFEPDPAVHDALRRMPTDHVPELFATGRFDGRAYDVMERVQGGSLDDLGFEASNPERLRTLVDELGRALASFAEVGLRHRDLRPETVLIRTMETFDLVITGFGSARLSDFDLEAIAPLNLTRYSAPEVIVGAVSAASDWWSLGMLALEQATRGQCFAGVNDKAFLLHVVTRGMTIPADLDDGQRLLLRGLLARDPLSRWGWPQVRAWLAGETVEVPDEDTSASGNEKGPPITLGGRQFRRPESFALAASETVNWGEGRDLTLRGALATWLDERGSDLRISAEVRRIATDEDLSEDFRHSLAMMAVSRDLPLAVSGEIVTPAWLLANPELGYDIVVGAVARHLDRMKREPWLVKLRTRAEAVRERARLLEIELDESRLRPALLASSRANLEAERERLRRILPDTDHLGLASILERARISDEDLVILVGADIVQFTPLAPLVDASVELAARASIELDRGALPELLARPRREIFAAVDERVVNFARCGIERVDNWAEVFRVERRMPLPQAAVLLAVPAARWTQPPKQQYIANLLEHFEKRVSGAVARGPLARFVIGKTTPRVDVAELGTPFREAEVLVNHVLSRNEAPIALDPAAYGSEETLEGRLRRLVNHASMFRRDTGIDGRYLGFPFLLARDSKAKSAAAKPRLAPVLLWPVAFDMEAGLGAGRGATLAFDRERDEVRVNPALEGLLGEAEFRRWKAAKDDLLARPGLRVPDVMDVLAHLAAPRGRAITRLPGKDAKLVARAMEIIPAGALFNAEFTGQAVAEDLRAMKGKPLAGTALEAALRISEPPIRRPLPPLSERDRYLTVESDPSQDDAVQRSRQTPGLLVEGPPGTGKSQTIVNIVADALGHRQTVLIICQKQAALKVVQKRLNAEGLGDRLFILADVNADRTTIVNALRAQVPSAHASDPGRVATLRRQREDVAGRTETLEGDVDRRHGALHAVDDATGLTYRGLIGELIGAESAGLAVDVPRLRPLLGAMDRGQLSTLEETCGPLARLWLAARFEGSPLSCLRSFAVDAGVEQTFREDLLAYSGAEADRAAVPADREGPLETGDPAALRSWIERRGSALSEMTDDARQQLSGWLDLFQPDADSATVGARLITRLAELATKLGAVDASRHDVGLFEKLCGMPDAALRKQMVEVREANTDPGLLGRLSPLRWMLRSRVSTLAEGLGGDLSPAFLRRLDAAMELEFAVRPMRGTLTEVQKALRVPAPGKPLGIEDLCRDTAGLLASLKATQTDAAAVFECPAESLAEKMARQGTPEAYVALKVRLELACARYDARERSLAALQVLEAWFEQSWVDECRRRVVRDEPTAVLTDKVQHSLGALAPYQRYRARAAGLPAGVQQTFGVLRQSDSLLGAVPLAELDGVVRRTIRREALLASKGRLEAVHPELLYEREEIEAKVAALGKLDSEMRELNKRLLAIEFDRTRLGNQTAWDDITRLRGPRMRRLREILERGGDLGLMQLRPIWLMSPDVASRVLPLRAALFDLVIYDEASQMPVEHAVPSLFRASRVVISGDEKQMPPSSFFSGAMEADEDEHSEGDDLDDGATEAERMAHEETWNRREVKDCPDLLQLGRCALPTTTLQIHYRSNYRELIGFSNAAYYGGDLSVPARQPEEEVRRARPVEVVRVDGVYASQINDAEADRVVQIMAGIWARPADACPSVGVVTFNRKQADLVEDALERHALSDPGFQAAMRRERDRKQGGEDMGFFVKNVENVQGDERDVIVFSTTFGRDARGTFRRSFGVLGQTGGERRLNVAVTRARDKVILVTSMPVADVSDWLAAGRSPSKPRDYLQAYLDYAAKVDSGEFDQVRNTLLRLGAGSTSQSRDAGAEGDGFSEAVGSFVGGLGYQPVSAAEAGDAFSLDYAVVDPRTGLFGIGIECDSPRHPLLARARAREIWRGKVLRRAVPAVHRVSSYDWYHRPQHERERLRTAVQAAVG